MALTDYIIMPGDHYQAACDKIRERTGKTDMIRSADMAAEIDNIPSGSELTVLTGTFTPAEDTKNISVSHNLGKMPKIIFVFLENEQYHVATAKSSSPGLDLYRPSLAAYAYGHSVVVYGSMWNTAMSMNTKYYTDIDITSTAANSGLISGVTDISLTVDTSNLPTGPSTSPSSLRGGSTYRYIVAG